MENENVTPKTHLNQGIVIGVVLVVLFILFYVFNLMTNQGLAFLPAIVFIILIIIAQRNHAKALDGHITFGNLFAMGFKTAAVATCIYFVFLILFILLVPGYKTQMMDMIQQKMSEKGTLTEEQINMAMSMTKRFFTASTLGTGLIGNLIVGCIGALIGAGVTKKNPRPQSPGV